MIVYAKKVFKVKQKLGPKKEKADYEAWMAKHGITKSKPTVSRKIYVPPKPFIRDTVFVPSLDSGIGNATKPVEGKRYTGDKIIGIATMHKSNAVPVFQADECKDLSSMRR